VSPRIRVEVEGREYRLGDSVTGRVVVEEGGDSRGLEVTLAFCERSPDYTNALAGATQRLHEGDLVTGASFAFTLATHAEGRPSFRSAHGELFWQVQVKSDELGRDTHAQLELPVAPRG